MTRIRLLSEMDLTKLNMSYGDILADVELAYCLDASGLVEVPTKIGVHPDAPNSFSHAMPAWVGGDTPALGIKWISYHPGNLANNLPDSWGVLVINDPHTGEPLCFMEGMYITFLRTAACAAVVAKRLAHQPTALGLIGCGGLGKASLAFMRHVFPSLKKVYVSSRRPESREAFCARFDSDACRVIPVANAEELLAESEIVVTSLPPVEVAPVQPGMLRQNSIFIPLDIDFSWASPVVDEFHSFYADNISSFQKLLEQKVGQGRLRPDAINSTQSLVAGKSNSACTNGKHFVAVCGIASVDVVIAANAYQRAIEAGVGSFFQMR